MAAPAVAAVAKKVIVYILTDEKALKVVLGIVLGIIIIILLPLGVIIGVLNGDVEIDSTAVIYGNIKSKAVQISSGAVVEGMCQQVYASVDVSHYFEDGIQNLDDNSQ